MAIAIRDDNRVPVLIGVSSTDLTGLVEPPTVVTIAVNPSTNAVVVEVA